MIEAAQGSLEGNFEHVSMWLSLPLFGQIFLVTTPEDKRDTVSLEILAAIHTHCKWGVPEHASTAMRVVSSFLPAASCVVAEEQYFDLDYRSEFSATHETTFSARNPNALRLHFFSSQPTTSTLAEAVQEIQNSYLGYIVLRPQVAGAVGRSLIPPPAEEDAQVRTRVRETNELFGTYLQAYGVPFMQQDGALLVCAHVSAWICHYTMVLRGLVQRIPSARFHSQTRSPASKSRSFPSIGLTSTALAEVLTSVGLPPEYIADQRLRTNPGLEWYHRPALREALYRNSTYEVIKENLTSSVCRYLNSGIPVIMFDASNSHTYVICGYKRNASDATGGISSFVVMNDNERPFTQVHVEPIVKSLCASENDASDSHSLLVPLPLGAWMSGETAEYYGASLFSLIVKSVACVRIPDGHSEIWKDLCLGLRERGIKKGVSPDNDAINEDGKDRKFSIRSYLTTGSSIKVDFRRRSQSTFAAGILATTKLPKYVWVVEVIDREAREKREDSCVGTIVLDASDSTPRIDSVGRSSHLFTHLPGIAIATANVREVIALESVTGVERQQVNYIYDQNSSAEPSSRYESGRWDQGSRSPGSDKDESLRLAQNRAEMDHNAKAV